MKRFLKFILSLTIGAIVFFVVVRKGGFSNIERAFALFFNWQGAILAVLTLLFFGVGVWKWRLLIKSTGYNCSWKNLANLWLSSFLVSYLTPFTIVGGEFFKVYAADKKCPDWPIEKNIASVFVDRVLNTTILILFLFAGFIVFAWRGYGFSSFINIGILSTLGLMMICLAVFYFKRLKRESIVEWFLGFFGLTKKRIGEDKNGQAAFESEREIFALFSARNRYFWQAVALTLLQQSILWLRAGLLILFLARSFHPVDSLVVFAFVSLAGLTPLPANLGLLELGGGLAFGNLGLGFNGGLVFAMVWRAADLFLCLLGALSFVKVSVKLAELKLGRFFESFSSKDS